MVSTIEKIDELVNKEGYTPEGAHRKMIEEVKTEHDNKSNKTIDKLAETMTDQLLKKLFDHLNNTVQPADALLNSDR